MFVQNLINALSVGSVYALIAIGYNLVYGILELLNFAHGDVYAVGCFVTFMMIASGLNPFLAILGGMIAGYIVNMLVERFAYRPVRYSGRVAPTISAVGIAYIMRNFIMVFWGPETFSFDLGIFSNTKLHLGNIIVGTLQIYIFLTAVAFMLIITLVLKKTKWGQAIIGISQSIPTTSLMGVPVNRVISIVYGLGAAVGVIGGLLFCNYYGFIYVGIGFMFGTMKAWMSSILGGVGSLKGCIIGALCLGLAEVMVAAYVSTSYKDAIVWGLFIVFVLFKPKGLFPAQIAEKV
ncbi:MAG: branched-chain amino acid ABC transporter permease [Clostridiales bacterium]|nr:branched-chain amino acid ABC transporter permease [Clostridiales bacterium]